MIESLFDELERQLGVAGLILKRGTLIDATVVRLILVPALMKLLGDANWWMPAWLGRRADAGSSTPYGERVGAP